MSILTLLTLASAIPCMQVDSTPAAMYARIIDQILHHPATAQFLGVEMSAVASTDVVVVDSLYTIDRFPFDRPVREGDEISVYKADVLRPLRTFPAPWMPHHGTGDRPRGILFVSRDEEGVVIAEVFVVRQGSRAYEEYALAKDSLKFMVRCGRDGTIRSILYVLLLR
ncbi:MAG: hypothetical protein AB1428_09225 [Bacteroidota bacterium]